MDPWKLPIPILLLNVASIIHGSSLSIRTIPDEFIVPPKFPKCTNLSNRTVADEFSCILNVLQGIEGDSEAFTHWFRREEDYVDDAEKEIWVACPVSDPEALNPHICIFPSGRWANPEEFAVGPFTFHTFTDGKPWYEQVFALIVDNTYNGWTVNPHETHNGAPLNYISSCMYNIYGANLKEPWKDLATFDTGFWGPVSGSWKRYFGQVSTTCHFTSCDPNLYISFNIPHMDQIQEKTLPSLLRCQGYYVIDYIPSETYAHGPSCGRPSYRHLHYSCYIRFHRPPNFESCLDAKYLQVGLYLGTNLEVDKYKEKNDKNYKEYYDKFLARTFVDNVKFGHEHIPNQTDYKQLTCLKEIMEVNQKALQFNGHNVELDIRTSAQGDKFFPPCGSHYRESENFDIEFGQQPWLVSIDVGQEKMPCSGTLLSPRHVLTVATCICDPNDNGYNIWRGSSVNACIDRATRKPTEPRRMHYGGSREFREIIIRPPYKSPSGRPVQPRSFEVLWVSLHPKYEPHTREYNIAILGTLQTMQFTHFFYPICLPDPSKLAHNHAEKGTILFSLKALQKMKQTEKKFTSQHNAVKYGTCISECNYKLERNCSATEVCGEFHTNFENKHKKIFPNLFMERMASIDIQYQIMKDVNLVEYCRAVDLNRPPSGSPNRNGKCLLRANNVEHEEKAIFGYCDDSNRLLYGVNPRYPLRETLTTIVHNRDCNLPIDTKTKICTAYVPRTPTTYILRDTTAQTNVTQRSFNYEVKGYLHGSYRSYFPRMDQKLRMKKLDRFGNPLYSKDDVNPHYGFPPELQICHPHLIDVGAPSYVRRVVLDEKTKAPKHSGSGTAILISLQSGRRLFDGKICNLQRGYYTDEEVLLTKEILEFIRDEIMELKYFDYLVDIRRYFVPLRFPAVTPSSWKVTRTTTSRVKTTSYNPWNGRTFRHIPEGKPGFYENEHWPGGINPLNNFSIFEDIVRSGSTSEKTSSFNTLYLLFIWLLFKIFSTSTASM